MYKLTNKDYKLILKYYKLPIPRNKKNTRKKAVNILANKLCKCIKKNQKIKRKYTVKKYINVKFSMEII